MCQTAVIGLTGPTGAGKSALRPVFEEYGCRFADCDYLARVAVEPGAPALAKLAEAFGHDILRADGSLDRALLAQRAFPTAEGRVILNGIVHPAVIDLLEDIIFTAQSENAPGVVIDAPLLFESELDKRCDAVIAVVAPDELRLERIMARDGLTEEAARLRMSAQHDCSFYSDRADYTLVNDGSVTELCGKARRMLDDIFVKGDTLWTTVHPSEKN